MCTAPCHVGITPSPTSVQRNIGTAAASIKKKEKPRKRSTSEPPRAPVARVAIAKLIGQIQHGEWLLLKS